MNWIANAFKFFFTFSSVWLSPQHAQLPTSADFIVVLMKMPPNSHSLLRNPSTTDHTKRLNLKTDRINLKTDRKTYVRMYNQNRHLRFNLACVHKFKVEIYHTPPQLYNCMENCILSLLFLFVITSNCSLLQKCPIHLCCSVIW